MGMIHITSAMLIALTSLIPASCHKNSPQQNAPKTPALIESSATPTNASAIHDLGDVALTNHFETCVQLGGGKNCTLTPRMIDRHNVQITLALESRTPAGKTRDLSVTQIIAKDGKSLEVAVGDFSLSLTPRISEN